MDYLSSDTLAYSLNHWLVTKQGQIQGAAEATAPCQKGTFFNLTGPKRDLVRGEVTLHWADLTKKLLCRLMLSSRQSKGHAGEHRKTHANDGKHLDNGCAPHGLSVSGAHGDGHWTVHEHSASLF